MKNLVALLLGAALAITIGCAAQSGKKMAAAPASAGMPDAAPMPQGSPRAEIDRLDADITAEMAKAGLARPAAAPLTCVGAACASEMTRFATAIKTPPKVCTGKTATCSDVCTLKDSICSNAARICDLAAQLGTDDSANDKCNQGKASCDAATERCCGCL